MKTSRICDDDDLIVEVDDSAITITKPPVNSVRPAKPPKKRKGTSLPMSPVSHSAPATTLTPTISVSALTTHIAPLFDFSGSKLTPAQQVYVMSYAVRGTQLGACKLAGCTIRQVREWMQEEEFMAALDYAISLVADRLEEELIRRAMDGSDKLLMRAVEAARPDKYARIIKGNVNMAHSWADLARELSEEGVATDET